MICVVGIASKVIKIYGLPIHLRWELYPIPHEKDFRYGGSYLEEVDWWKKPRKKNFLNFVKFLFIEILFVRVLYHNNRKMWYLSFPLHFGLYLVIVWLGLLFLAAVLLALGLSTEHVLILFLQGIATVLGVVGFILAAVGCVGLIIRRATAKQLQGYSAPIDYFNLVFILTVVASGFFVWLGDSRFLTIREYLTSLITFSYAGPLGSAITLHIILFSLFAIYLPFTHMSHAFMKFFLWDKVLFEDEPNLKGGSVESRVTTVLNYKQTWSAPHMHAGGTWSETASKGVDNEEK
ncbi:MAG: respiratory nitrate reductase subunit gamma [Deltaproteobacteria bacterium]|nr:respiratory nitrate reductase subunit gamma [Deltaproteobacteria bacterium]